MIHVREQREETRLGVRLPRLLVTPPTYTQDVRDLVLHLIADCPPNWVKIEVRSVCSLSSHIDACPERTVHTKSCYTLLIPGILRDFLALPPATTARFSRSRPSHPDRDTAPERVKHPLLFATSPFSHACPMAPGDQSRICSVSGEEKSGASKSD